MNLPSKLLATLVVVLVVAACSAHGSFSRLPETPAAHVRSQALRGSTTPIQHVIFIVQENRSFNNLFMGYPGAKTQNYGYDTKGHKIVLRAQDLAQGWDIDHFSPAFFAACDGQGKLPGTRCKMDGWDNG